MIDSGMLDNELVDGAESGSGGLERKARLALIDLLQKCSNFPGVATKRYSIFRLLFRGKYTPFICPEGKATTPSLHSHC